MMVRFRNLYFPEGETILPEHMAAAGSMRIAGAGTYQAHKLIKALPYVKTFEVAVDVGANVGTWARVLARLFNEVHCFEPVDTFRECLELNIVEADRPRVRVHDCALGAEDGELELMISKRSSGWTHAVPTAKGGGTALDNSLKKHSGGHLEFTNKTVSVKRLDSFKIERMDFLKIDVEGFELNVVRGGAELIRKHKPTVIVEQKPGTPDRYGFDAKGAVKELQRMGASLAFEWSGDYCLYWK